MKNNINLLFILISLSFSTILNVDNDGSQEFITIQSAIDNAGIGDTILVHQGLYYENLDINKTITLTSLAMYDNLDIWYDYQSITAQYEINNDNIINTIIDASQPIDENFKSGIVVRSSENECIAPVIMGFTIRGGMGTMVREEVEISNGQNFATEEVDRMIGGGLFSYITNVDIHHNQFINNGDSNVENGGAVYAQTSTEDWGFDNRSLGQPRCDIDEINIHNNFYRDNDAIYGNTFSNRTFIEEINLTNSLFDIYNCPESNVTGLWVDKQIDAVVDYSGSQGDLCAITDDIWISPNGSNLFGLGTEDSPLKTITYALEIVAPSNNNPVNLFLSEGTYSPSITGESFPLNVPSNVNIYGEGSELTILDAEQTSTILIFYNSLNNSINSLKIYNGNKDDYSGGGFIITNSHVEFYSVGIYNNTSTYSGGGGMVDGSFVNFESVIFSENYAMNSGGGLTIYNQSEIFMENVHIYENQALHSGGGIFAHNDNIDFESEIFMENVHISENRAMHSGGGVFLHGPTLNFNIDNSIIHGNQAEHTGGGINFAYSNIEMNNTDIYDNNSQMDGGGLSSTMSVVNLDNIHIYENNTQGSGGGIIFTESDVILNNLIINENTSSFSGGGGFFNHTNINMNNIQIYENNSGHSGGGFSFHESNGIINQITVVKNIANYLNDINYPHHGGGIYTYGSPNLFIVNSIIINNLLNENSNDIEALSGTTYEAVEVSYTNFGIGIGVYFDESNDNQNPLFIDYNNNDFALNTNSPCIDTGINYYEFSNTLILDLNQDSYFGSSPDRGALEKIYGDMNQDNIINIQDIIIMMNMIFGNIDITDTLLNQGDLYGDDLITINDIIEIISIIYS